MTETLFRLRSVADGAEQLTRRKTHSHDVVRAENAQARELFCENEVGFSAEGLIREVM